MTFPFFLSFEAEGFGFKGGDEGVAIGDDLTGYLVSVTADRDPIVFDGEESGDFSNRELGPLGSISKEVESERSFIGLVARAFLLIPIGIEGEEGVMAFVAIEEATCCIPGGGDGEGSFLARFEAKDTAFGSSEDLFFVELSSRVFTILYWSGQNIKKTNREKKKRARRIS